MATPAGAPPAAPTAQPAPARSRPARVADGVELLGEYEGSGYKQAPYIARRADGQVIQLTQLLHLVAEEADGERTNAQIARAVSERFGRRVSAGNVQFLVERKLRPLGVLAAADGSSPEVEKVDPLLALRFRTALVPERVVTFLTRFLWPLYLPPVLVLALAAIVGMDVWLFFFHGVAPGLRAALYDPAILLLLFGFVVVATGFHELGHATACRYGGAQPGALGAGIYLVWPVFYCDVTDAYRLGKAARLRVDLGGIYFNGVFALGCGIAFLATGFEPLLFVVVLQHLAVFQQLLPVLRLDGYYVISDLTGVPDILTRIRPILRSLIPGRKSEERVTELKPWVRVAVSAYVVALIPFLVLILVVMIISAPRVFATAWDSLGMQVDRMRGGLSGGRALTAAAGGLQTVALVLPAAGTVASLGRLGRRIAAGLGRWAKGSGPRSAALAAVVAALAALTAYTWWPSGDYRPIGPDDRGTVGGAVRSIESVPSGRPTTSESDTGPDSEADGTSTTTPDGSSPANSQPDQGKAPSGEGSSSPSQTEEGGERSGQSSQRDAPASGEGRRGGRERSSDSPSPARDAPSEPAPDGGGNAPRGSSPSAAPSGSTSQSESATP